MGIQEYDGRRHWLSAVTPDDHVDQTRLNTDVQVTFLSSSCVSSTAESQQSESSACRSTVGK